MSVDTTIHEPTGRATMLVIKGLEEPLRTAWITTDSGIYVDMERLLHFHLYRYTVGQTATFCGLTPGISFRDYTLDYVATCVTCSANLRSMATLALLMCKT